MWCLCGATNVFGPLYMGTFLMHFFVFDPFFDPFLTTFSWFSLLFPDFREFYHFSPFSQNPARNHLWQNWEKLIKTPLFDENGVFMTTLWMNCSREISVDSKRSLANPLRGVGVAVRHAGYGVGWCRGTRVMVVPGTVRHPVVPRDHHPGPKIIKIHRNSSEIHQFSEIYG